MVLKQTSTKCKLNDGNQGFRWKIIHSPELAQDAAAGKR